MYELKMELQEELMKSICLLHRLVVVVVVVAVDSVSLNVCCIQRQSFTPLLCGLFLYLMCRYVQQMCLTRHAQTRLYVTMTTGV